MHRLILPFILTAAMAAAQTPAAAPAKPKPSTTAATASVGDIGPSVSDLKYPQLPQVKIPEVANFTLSNGIRLYLLENHELPLIGGFALVRTGNLFDPKDKVGLAQITGEVLRTGGTKGKTGDQLDVELENMASSVESDIGETSGRVDFSTLKENVDPTLAIFKAVLTSPEFRQDKIELVKSQIKGGIARRNDDAHGIAQREFPNIIYGRDNPYGWDMQYKHIDAIQRPDLMAFYKRYFFPANIIVAVQGDFKTDEMKAKLEKLFSDWTDKQPAVPKFPEATSKTDGGIHLAVKNDVTQTFFTMGHLGGVLNNPDYPALEVMNDILGGGFSSRLFKSVRTRQGLAYSVGSAWGANYDHPGLFRISGSTKSQSTVAAIKAVENELEKIRTTEVTDQELATAKQSALNSFVFYFDSPGKTLSRLVSYEYYGYPRDFIFQFQKGVEKVTKADVLRVAKEYLHPDKLTVVAVGKPDDFGTALTSLGKVEPIDLTIPEPKAASAPAASADPASQAKGKQILQRAQQALGGVEKLASVKDAVIVNQVQIQSPQGAMNAKQRAEWVAPGSMKVTQELPFGKIVVFSDGKSGWMQTPQGTGPLPPPVQKQVEEQMFRNPLTLYMSDRNPQRKVNATGDNSIEISDSNGANIRIEFDPSTGLPAKQTYSRGGNTVVETLSDYKDQDGLKLPSKFVIEQNGAKFAEGTLQEFSVNTGLTGEALGKKP